MNFVSLACPFLEVADSNPPPHAPKETVSPLHISYNLNYLFPLIIRGFHRNNEQCSLFLNCPHKKINKKLILLFYYYFNIINYKNNTILSLTAITNAHNTVVIAYICFFCPF